MPEPSTDKDIQRFSRRLADDGQKTRGYFQGLKPADWHQPVYTTGSGWTVREVLAHFVSAEQAFQSLLEDVTQGGPGAPRDMDVVAFNESDVPRFSSQSPQTLLDAFALARTATVELTRRLSPPDLARRGYHPFFGDSNMESMLKLIYRHNMIHMRDVRKALRTGKPVAHVEVTPPSRAQERVDDPVE